MHAYPVIPTLLLNSAAAGLLVLLVLLVQWLFRRHLSPQWRCALWLVVVARLLLPVSIGSPVSLMQWLPRPATASPALVGADAPMTASETTNASVRSGVPVPQFSLLPVGEIGSSPMTEVGRPPISRDTEIRPMDAPPSAASPPSKSAQLPWAAIVFSAWFAGVAVLGANVLWSAVRLGRRFRGLPEITDPGLMALLRSCAIRMNVRRIPRMAESADVASPALHGFLRPRLLLPAGFTRDFSPEEMRLVFLHELAHVKRRDLPLHWLITVLQVVHWFNPLLWLGFARWRADREIACDTLALEAAGADQSQNYGRTILHLLERNGPRLAGSGLVGILEDRRQLRRRLEMISAFVPGRQRSLLALTLVGALSAVGLTDAQATKPAADRIFAAGFTHLTFVIDTSGSMRDDRPRLRPDVINEFLRVLKTHPEARFFSVLDNDGRPIVTSATRHDWLSNDEASRKAAIHPLNVYREYSQSHPVAGLRQALRPLGDPAMRLSVYVIGDEFVGDAGLFLRQLEALNPPDAQGRRRASIHAIQLPTAVMATGTMRPTGAAFTTLLTQVATIHGGTFALLPGLNMRVPLAGPRAGTASVFRSTAVRTQFADPVRPSASFASAGPTDALVSSTQGVNPPSTRVMESDFVGFEHRDANGQWQRATWGALSRIPPTQLRAVRLKPDGTVDPNFAPSPVSMPLTGNVTMQAIQPDGSVVVGGPFLGVEAMTAPRTIMEHLGNPTANGVVVADVLPDGPANNLIRIDDILLALNGQKLTDAVQFAGLLRSHKPGDEITLTYFRAGREGSALVKLGQRPAAALRAPAAVYSAENLEFEEVPVGERSADAVQFSPGTPMRRSSVYQPGDVRLMHGHATGTLQLIKTAASTSIEVKNTVGAVTFSGPFNTAAERRVAPISVQARAESLLNIEPGAGRSGGGSQPPTTSVTGAASQVLISANNANAGIATRARDASGRDTLSIDFPDESIRSILTNVADLIQLNVAIPETLEGKTSLKLRDVTWRQIFKTVLDPVGHTFVEEGNLVRIMKSAPVPVRIDPVPSYTYNDARGSFEVSGFTSKPNMATATRLAFVIDTSGSMRNAAEGFRLYSVVGQLLAEELVAHPGVKEFAVVNSDGGMIASANGASWLPNDDASRQSVVRTLATYDTLCESNPVPGIFRVLTRLADAATRLDICVIGDEFISTPDAVLKRLEELNPADAQGNRRITISAIQLPTALSLPDPEVQVTGIKFRELMTQVAKVHGGTYRVLAGLFQTTLQGAPPATVAPASTRARE